MVGIVSLAIHAFMVVTAIPSLTRSFHRRPSPRNSLLLSSIRPARLTLDTVGTFALVRTWFTMASTSACVPPTPCKIHSAFIIRTSVYLNTMKLIGQSVRIVPRLATLIYFLSKCLVVSRTVGWDKLTAQPCCILKVSLLSTPGDALPRYETNIFLVTL